MPPMPGDQLRVAMALAPVNPSDLIPVTGAYAHRIKLPAIAGYEGVGVVVDAPRGYHDRIGQRVLPLRGTGTWQCFVDCDPELAITVPEDIDNLTAARSFINPLAALRLLDKWPVRGKRILLTGAGSTCANLLGLWAERQGAANVFGIYRSHERLYELKKTGITPVHIGDRAGVRAVASTVDITFDALGGPVATSILESMQRGSTFVAYGLLTGLPVKPSHQPQARYQYFHLRHELATMTIDAWQRQFRILWPRLRGSKLPRVQLYSLDNWRHAIADHALPGQDKPMIRFL